MADTKPPASASPASKGASGAGGAKPKKPAKAPTTTPAVAPVAIPARMKRRHRMIIFSFLLIVILPTVFASWYLWNRAVDQYASRLGFTVRREDPMSAGDVLGRLSNISSASSSDSDILYAFIQSQEMVLKIDQKMDLRQLYSVHYEQDPVFSLKPGSSVEDLVNYWQRMVQVAYAPGTGLLELQVLAFTAEDAQKIAEEIFLESSLMINELSDIARQDAMRYAAEELENSVEQLRQARQEMTKFRTRTQIVDPDSDIRLQMGLLNTLQQQLGKELINYDMLRQTTGEGDPRVKQSEQRIAATRERIREEREKFGVSRATADGQDYASVISEFENLSVNLEFAEQKYTAALTNFDVAQADAQRKSRYLAAFVRPTLPESAEYPRRIVVLGLAVLFITIAWSIMTLIFYALRDRR